MSKVVSSTELQKNTRKVIAWARNMGDTIIVETYGKPVVAILDIKEYEKLLRIRQEHIRQRFIESLGYVREATEAIPPEEVEQLVNKARQAMRFSHASTSRCCCCAVTINTSGDSSGGSMSSEGRKTRDYLLRVVVDTNVLISGLLSTTDDPKRIIDGWLAGEFTLLISDDMLEECGRVLEYPKLREGLKLAIIPKDKFIAMLRTGGEKVEMSWPDLSGVARDPFDEILLDCAVSGSAHYLVSRDENLPTPAEYEGLKVVSPSEFVEILEQQSVEEGGTSPLPA